MKKLVLLIIVLGLGGLLGGTAFGSTLNVPSQYPTIQDAIDAAVRGDEVLVGDGTYVENLDFLGKAITVQSVNGPQVTTIDGNGTASVVTFANQEGAGSRLEGFTITNGQASSGGGIRCDSYASPVIENCIITNNRATGNGGGMYLYHYSMPTINGCSITENISGVNGAGIWCQDHSSPIISNCTISGNDADRSGGAIALYTYCSPTIVNCTIDSNYSRDNGGGIYCTGNSSPTIRNCTINSNRAFDNGGGIYCNMYSSPEINNCIFSNNTGHGGGICCYNYSSATITNCTISRNAGYGSGIYCYRSSPTITNCTITDNLKYGIYTNDLGGAGEFPVVTNCIVWQNEGSQIVRYPSSHIVVNYSNIEGGWMGTGNIDVDPRFVDEENGDFHLQPMSPCIDGGDNAALGLPTHDFEGDPRIFDGDYDEIATVDMGADEYAYTSDRAYIELDREIYPLDVIGLVNMVVTDSGLNTDPNVIEEYSDVVIITTTGGDEEASVTLTEAGPNSSMFAGAISTDCTDVSPVEGDGVLQIAGSIADIIAATYYDADDGTGNPATYSDTARTDCFPPAISNVEPALVENTSATITWNTDEEADSRVCYGTSMPLDLSTSNSSLVTAHTVVLTGLTPATTYYFSVESTDEAGNQTIDDNGGAYYEFTTLPVGTYYVPDDFPTIQAALNTLSTSSSNEIVVRTGTYYENIDFLGKGLTVRSEGGPEVTIVDGNRADCVVSFVSGEGPSAVLDGFTITNGETGGDGTVAGILCDDSSPTITNCIVTNNIGQGISTNASPTISNCTISYNTGGWGSGISCYGDYFTNSAPTITSCIIENNTGDWCGAGIYAFDASPVITDSTIRNNDGGDGLGGGIFLMADASATIARCSVIGNSAGNGAGIYVDVSSSAIISECIVKDNTATDTGGGIDIGFTAGADPIIENCLIIGNTAPQGAGIHSVDSNPVFMNCTIADNTATQDGGGISCYDYYGEGNGPTVVNTILWGDTAGGSSNEVYVDFGASIDFTYCDIEGGWAGNGNIQSDPLFMGGGDYHLNTGSPCKDAGDNDPPGLPPTDKDGQPRVMDGTVDMGAFEYLGAVATVAHFSGAPISAPAPLTVFFTDQSIGTVDSWFWDFGEGGTSTEQNPSYTYTNEDSFTVSLTVSGPGGGDTQTRIDYVHVEEPALEAYFTANPTSGIAPLTVEFTDQSTGTVTDWSWSFGGGGSSTDQNPSHTFNSSGYHYARLTVTGPGGEDTDTKIAYIRVMEPTPVAYFTANPTSGIAPLTVDFTDQSTDEVTNWSWDFGDGGTGIEVNPSHTYSEAGDYAVSLTVTGPGGEDTVTKVDYIHVAEPPPPVAAFTADITGGAKPLSIQFTDQSTGAIASWFWAFGDGGTSTQQNPSYEYTEVGDYIVSLTVTGPGGSDTEAKTDYIHIVEPAPVAAFSGTPTTGDFPLDVIFTDASTGPVTGWSWDFGDGGTSTLQNPPHTYNHAGDYTVSLTVTGPGGEDTEVKQDYIHLSEPSLCECNLVPDTTPTIIPRGGTIGFQATVTNNTDNAGKVYFATKVTLPSLQKTRYIDGPVKVRLDPYQSKSGHISHTIPASVQLGTYIYHGYVGLPGVGIFDECQFEFTVSE